jgi:hypothetical protein
VGPLPPELVVAAAALVTVMVMVNRPELPSATTSEISLVPTLSEMGADSLPEATEFPAIVICSLPPAVGVRVIDDTVFPTWTE